jgi:hypothetical protein
VEVQERCDKNGPEPADNYSFLCGNGNGNYEMGHDYMYYKGESLQQLVG